MTHILIKPFVQRSAKRQHLPKSDSLRAAMRARLTSEQGKADYAQRSRTIEPV